MPVWGIRRAEMIRPAPSAFAPKAWQTQTAGVLALSSLEVGLNGTATRIYTAAAHQHPSSMHSIVVYASRLLRGKICTKPAGRVHASRDGLLAILTFPHLCKSFFKPFSCFNKTS